MCRVPIYILYNILGRPVSGAVKKKTTSPNANKNVIFSLRYRYLASSYNIILSIETNYFNELFERELMTTAAGVTCVRVEKQKQKQAHLKYPKCSLVFDINTV